MKPRIEVRQLSKRYEAQGIFMKSFRQRFEEAWRQVLAPTVTPKEGVWVLKDLNFDVAPGEIVGLVGKNGAGKTTLLRILSQLTEPSSGSARLRGKVASLLEMGSGFHPDLTGRENVFLNGAFLGMRQHEVKKQLAQIIDFSEIGAFIDFPIKKYSKGMYVRLAFAVAVHLNSDILLMDEILDSGDAAFQEKCLSRVESLAKQGKSILFVSHQLAHLERLCPRSLLLEGATLADDGPTSRIVKRYGLPFEGQNAPQKEGRTF